MFCNRTQNEVHQCRLRKKDSEGFSRHLVNVEHRFASAKISCPLVANSDLSKELRLHMWSGCLSK